MKEVLQYRIADTLTRLVPRSFSYRVSAWVADFCWRTDHVGRQGVMANLRRVLEYQGRSCSPEELEQNARRTFRSFAKYLVDFFFFRTLKPEQIDALVTIENREYVAQALHAGKGVLMATAHLGNWELGGAVLAGLGYPLHVIALPQKDPRLDRFFQDHRRRRGMHVIRMGQAARDILGVLRQNQIVALLVDRDYTMHQDQTVFFGAPARLPRGPARLAMGTGAAILPGFLLRESGDRYRLRFHEPVFPGPAWSTEKIQRHLCVLMEEEIGREPFQWYMFRDVWDSRAYGPWSS